VTAPILTRRRLSWCAACGYVGRETLPRPRNCPTCGAPLGRAAGEAVTEAPPGVLGCARCGARNVPVVFRGWSRVYGFFLWVKETRSGAYVCRECAETLTTMNLVVTALLGWWALQSFFWSAPRATYFNWRAIGAPPGDPLAWGGIRLDKLLAAIDAAKPAPEPEEAEEVFEDSPLTRLTAAEQELVLNAPDPYAELQLRKGATDAQVKAAWRKQAKANHPDLNPGDAEAKARMTAINQAYELLRDPRLRKAYDYLVATGSRP
jgi:hypothetical protein